MYCTSGDILLFYLLIYLQGDKPYDVVERYQQRNRAPIPPDPKQLERIRSQKGPNASVGTDVEGKQCTEDAGLNSESPTDDEEEKSRARRHSRKHYTGSTDDPRKLGFYPAQWRDVLERAKKLWRPWMAFECGFPERETKEHLDMATKCVIDALSKHQESGGKVEQGK
jgi:hypothetical protein